ncbi:RagB/SusD family nutrient uptake outer membrane protein [Sphingobacterium hungaricum]|uniref:RagB/SusD family nutrient uptake outer membrane protein n=1 Tax=Sphingobacterium hungaricum TaxID=2082723 RepID=A0A928UZ40_9SPHI|nr:RagB/SusD family nutrient uptake outer membrane protein [Sphingobacterium hungaricum]MBE8714065.1 RagB/SusD family nutrient uptake outer membrane protein [Sphingobacterium hungaricum]
MKKIINTVILTGVLFFSGCNKFMDIVPDNVAELDQAFSMRTMAERFLFTCYSWIPGGNVMEANPALLAGDEFWLNSTTNFSQGDFPNWYIAMGSQNANSPLLNYWDGNAGGTQLWRGIRECNIFLENIQRVPDMDQIEKDRWAAEVKFLKAYYHYYLMRMYGPIPIVEENIPIFEDPDNVNYERQPIDDVFAYIVGKIDEAIPALMEDVMLPAQENGRITQIVAKAMKAEILIAAASPLFNGNTDYPGYNNATGQPLFNATFSVQKWQLAADACKEAIDVAHAAGKSLYKWNPSTTMIVAPQQSTIFQMSLRQAITERTNNSEAIWINNRSTANQSHQGLAFMPRSIDPARISNQSMGGYMAPTLNMALKFYSKNGVPIEEDFSWDYSKRFDLRDVPLGESPYQYNLIPGHTTVGLHFDREDRFYASLSFDGGRYFMSSHNNDNLAFNINARPGGNAAATNSPTRYSGTGYTPKKLVSYYNLVGEANNFTSYNYPYSMMRLGNLYLLYAEALNELFGPGDEIFFYLDAIRARSGLKGVIESWSDYSIFPDKPNTQEGLRDIIRRERTIEMAFESQRFWDLRRWKTAQVELNTPIYGWDFRQSTPQTYYRRVVMYNRTFTLRDYFWPISINELRRNDKLLQSPLW